VPAPRPARRGRASNRLSILINYRHRKHVIEHTPL
jgi:hypothetical protein